ncbi:Hsp20/alpha crystallin family protein [Leptodesmis sichuanensis]|uniref:Hsp20/alpha crystallin family protein n=1 Tax=Leptodesmis sichuanensis TaxID=2906798 RepID=UPI001F386C7A|nr:Hsp20/alpha crystallin family protein [Leptodesmis sichuanensis]UIE39553.1 Hsp20/alpha crystallin family protein [Leptodesmis sichuanensis A121]
MSLMQWQPFKDLNTLRQQMNHLFDELTHRHPESGLLPTAKGGLWTPAIEVQETDTDVILKAEIPGIAAQDLDVRVGETSVSIAGEHREETKTEKQGYFHSELHYGSFHRVVPLPVAVQNDQVKADFKDGLLTLTMPKIESARPNMVKVDLAMEQKVRDTATQQRQHEERRQEQVHTRVSADLETPPDGIKEEARELTASQRLYEEELQDKVHTRASQEVNAPTVP